MMTYAKARALIRRLKEADIVLVREKGLKHAINRILQRSRWHHVMIYIGKGHTMEVTPRNGSHMCDLFHDLTEKQYLAIKVLRDKSLTLLQRKGIARTAVRCFNGRKFSWMQYARIVVGRTLSWKRNPTESRTQGQARRYRAGSVACSNMVAMAYYEAGHSIIAEHMPEFVVPKDYEEAKGLKTIMSKKLM